ncbi:MAG: PQQ-binding-like beta-propeller repeat protein [Acidimicrobiales bacterium]
MPFALALALVLLANASCTGEGKGSAGAGGEAEGGAAVAEPTVDPAVATTVGTVPGERPDRALFLEEAWTWMAPSPASVGVPAADRDAIAVTAGHHLLVLLDGKGKVRWQADRNGLREVAPALTVDLVVAATEDGAVAYDRATGQQRWQAVVGDEANTPVVVGGRAVITTWDGVMAAVDLADGKVAWRHALGAPSLGPATASRGTAVATFDDGRTAGATAVDVATGRQKWSVKLPEGGVSAPAVTTGGVVVVVAGDIAAHGLSLDDGSTRWRRGVQGRGSPEVAPVPLPDGSVLVAHRLGGLVQIDTSGVATWGLRTNGIAVRASPAGPGPNGWVALALDDGRFVLGGPDREPDVRQPPEPAMGVAVGPGGILVLTTAKARQNAVRTLTGW